MLTEMAFNAQNQLHWYAVQTRPRHEKRVRERLESKGHRCFLPNYMKMNHWKNGCTVRVELPLFPTYIFVELARSEFGRILVDRSVTRIIGTGREPVAIAEGEMSALRKAAQFGEIQPHDYLTIGEKVRIKNGPLADLVGILLRREHGLKVVLMVEMLRSAASVEVNLEDVEPLAA